MKEVIADNSLIAAGRASCADCPAYAEANDCAKFNNLLSNMQALLVLTA